MAVGLNQGIQIMRNARALWIRKTLILVPILLLAAILVGCKAPSSTKTDENNAMETLSIEQVVSITIGDEGNRVRLFVVNDSIVQTFLPAPAGTFSADAFVIQDVLSGKALEANTGSEPDKASVLLSPLNDANAQKWFFEPSGDGYYFLRNADSGLMLGVADASTGRGANVRQHQSDGSNAQKWQVVYSKEETCLLVSALGYVLSVSERTGANSEAITVDVATNSDAQRLRVTPAKRPSLTGDSWLDEQIENIAMVHNYDLWSCYTYVAYLPYVKGPEYPQGDWTVQFAREMIVDGCGNCYCFAALFCLLARQLGYDAKAISGEVLTQSEGWAAHGWTEIIIDGETYICDLTMFVGLPGLDWFLVTYDDAPMYYRYA